MKVGWAQDIHGYLGGAELTAQEFLERKPNHVTIEYLHPDPVEGEYDLSDCDVIVLHNIVKFGPLFLDAIKGKKIIKFVHDLWPDGNEQLKRYVLRNAWLTFCSNLHQRWFGWHVTNPIIVPPCLNLQRFRYAQDQPHDTQPAAIWLGRMNNIGKGIDRACEWSLTNETPIHFYGDGPYKPPSTDLVHVRPPVPYDKTPDLLASYQTFIHLPTWPETFGRSVMEAKVAGCEMVIAANMIGAVEYFDRQEEVEQSYVQFWDLVEQRANS